MSLFLVARNKTIDWIAVLVPAYIHDQNEDYSLVLETADGSINVTKQKMWTDTQENRSLLVYRKRILHASEIDEGPANFTLTDEFGREVYYIEGAIVEAAEELSETVAERILDSHHSEAIDALGLFWRHEGKSFSPITTNPSY